MNIDIEKRKIESRYIKPIRAIFRQMNQDAINLYKATKSVNAESVAINYNPDFLKSLQRLPKRNNSSFWLFRTQAKQKSLRC
jgi:hypothetical protein